MSRNAPTVVILTFLILAGHATASVFDLYTKIFWFDMVMHTLGGAWLASVCIAVGVLRYPAFFSGRSRASRVLRVITLVLLLGLGWELYEYCFGVWATAKFGDLGFMQPWTDTVSDLFLDVAGAALTALFLFRKEREVA